MKPMLRILSVFSAIVILNLIHMNYAYPGLSEITRRELKVAYMNGFIGALELPPDLIEKARKDPEFLKKEVLASAALYMEAVERMQEE
ncbi:MAG: hypothetical protein V3S89_14920 [Desulfobacterales bacterium]